jgi:ribonuclease PH
MQVPKFLEDEGRGWLTAEYSMLPGSTIVRKQRERGKTDSRGTEIQRLIGRSLRSIVDFEKIPGITITIDADVIEADGGTRTCSITGGYIALKLLVRRLMKEGKIKEDPLRSGLAAVSCGIVGDEALLDLCYIEDSNAVADMNFVGNEKGEIAEIQISGEKRTVSDEEFSELLKLAKKGVRELIEIQRKALED